MPPQQQTPRALVAIAMSRTLSLNEARALDDWIVSAAAKLGQDASDECPGTGECHPHKARNGNDQNGNEQA